MLCRFVVANYLQLETADVKIINLFYYKIINKDKSVMKDVID
jgi:hypothetical protein